MARVRNKDSKIEVAFRRGLWALGVRYRKNPRSYFGKPDLVIRRARTVIFIDSCFWHGCPKHFRAPKTKQEYWREKIARNRRRDREVTKHYKREGWHVYRYWEHDVIKKLSTILRSCCASIERASV